MTLLCALHTLKTISIKFYTQGKQTRQKFKRKRSRGFVSLIIMIVIMPEVILFSVKILLLSSLKQHSSEPLLIYANPFCFINFISEYKEDL